MSRFTNTLKKIGFLESDEDDTNSGSSNDVDALLAEISGGADEAEITADDMPPEPAEAVIDVTAGQTLDEIYQVAGVPPSPFPAEKLWSLLDGLKALPSAARMTAVKAMDEADDAWEINDPINDAETKIAALQQAKSKLQSDVVQAKNEADKKLSTEADYKAEATAAIKAQIAELEETLASELEKCAVNKVEIQASLQKTEESCQREQAKFDEEIERLSGLVDTFKPESEGVESNG